MFNAKVFNHVKFVTKIICGRCCFSKKKTFQADFISWIKKEKIRFLVLREEKKNKFSLNL